VSRKRRAERDDPLVRERVHPARRYIRPVVVEDLMNKPGSDGLVYPYATAET
jgi:hypothetical protein